MLPKQDKIYQKALETASDILDELGYSEPPISSIDIATYLGYTVVETEIPTEFSEIAGYVVEKEKRIVINSNDLLEYKIYAIAYQLGITLLNDSNTLPENQQLVLNKRHSFGELCRTDLEKAAHYFALNLLIPTNMLARYSSYDESTLSKIFIVPMKALQIQLETIK